MEPSSLWLQITANSSGPGSVARGLIWLLILNEKGSRRCLTIHPFVIHLRRGGRADKHFQPSGGATSLSKKQLHPDSASRELDRNGWNYRRAVVRCRASCRRKRRWMFHNSSSISEVSRWAPEISVTQPVSDQMWNTALIFPSLSLQISLWKVLLQNIMMSHWGWPFGYKMSSFDPVGHLWN